MGAKTAEIVVYCLTCSKKIFTTESQVKFGKDKYCSKECSDQRSRKKYSDQYLIDEFWRYHNENGRHPYVKDMSNKNGYPESSSYERRWGSWNKFLEAISFTREDEWTEEDEKFLQEYYYEAEKEYIINGLKYKREWSIISNKARSMGLNRSYSLRAFSDEYLISEFFRYYNEFNVYPLAGDINGNKDYPSSSSYLRRFKSWDNFLQHIGILGDDGWYKCDEEVVKKLYQDNKYETINNELMVKRSESTINHKANKLGIKKSYKFKYGYGWKSNEELINELVDFYNEYGRTPTVNDLDSNIYRRRFGSWNNALNMAELPHNIYVRSKRERELVLELIKIDYENNKSLDDIATKYGYANSASVSNIMQKIDIKKRNNRWTKNEINILKNNYPFSEMNMMLDLLPNRSSSDITTKAYKLNIKKENYYWNEDEEKILLEHYNNVSAQELTKLLPNRSYDSIVTKANKLGITQNYHWSSEDIELLKELYPKTNNKILSAIFSREVNSIVNYATKKGIYKNQSYWENLKEFSKEELIEILIKYSKTLGRTPTMIDLKENDETPSSTTYIRYFGSFSQACVESGLTPNSQLYGKSNTYLSKNGIICLSKSELMITNLLEDNIYVFQKEVQYSQIIDDVRCGLKRMDWLINDSIIVEFFGMMDKESYRLRTTQKLELCHDNGVDIISIYPEDLKNDYSLLKRKFLAHGLNLNANLKI